MPAASVYDEFADQVESLGVAGAEPASESGVEERTPRLLVRAWKGFKTDFTRPGEKMEFMIDVFASSS